MKRLWINYVYDCICRYFIIESNLYFLAMFGVSPEKAAHYQQKMEFRCLDGNKKFPMTFVNDDYCDCDDGSDEPGTSACPNGRFGFCISLVSFKASIKI